MTAGLLYAAAGSRALVTGLTGILLGLYLAELRLPPDRIGLVVSLGLAGGAAGTALAAWIGDRIDRRRALLAAAVLTSAGLAVFALTAAETALGAAAFAGMVNGMGRDRGVAHTLEQSILADALTGERRTRAFVRYALAQDVCGGLGALAAALPDLLQHSLLHDRGEAYRWTFGIAAAVSLAAAAAYLPLPASARRGTAPASPGAPRIGPDARRRVASLSALFALDSLGGGLLAGSILSYWFFTRFGMGGEVIGPVFFAGRALNALSYLAAEPLARRVGLLRTMVFTHLPSSVVLLALPFAPGPEAAVALFLAREALVQMDVPTRQAYVAAVTSPGERAFALGVTGLVRNAGWAVGPALAGAAIGAAGLGAPLLLGAGVKIVYDLALYAACRREAVES